MSYQSTGEFDDGLARNLDSAPGGMVRKEEVICQVCFGNGYLIRNKFSLRKYDEAVVTEVKPPTILFDLCRVCLSTGTVASKGE
jgi:hypothetical protein